MEHLAMQLSRYTEFGEQHHTLDMRELELIQLGLYSLCMCGEDRYHIINLIECINQILDQGPPQ